MILGKSSEKYSMFANKFRFKEIFSQNTAEFCKTTSLHGIKYMADTNLRPSERYFFGISIAAVICAVAYLITNVYGKWSSTPIIVGVNPEPTFITNEPFPAVTLCNMNQALSKVANSFPENSTQYTMLRLLCKDKVDNNDVKTITNWSQVEEFIVKISQPCEDMFIECQYGGRLYTCKFLFSPIVTDEGLCCVFNMIHPKYMYVKNYHGPHLQQARIRSYEYLDWHSESGYPDDLPPLYFPKKIAGAGMSNGLSIILDVEQDKYFCSSSSSVGFKVALHAPNETPNLKETGVFIEPGKETNLRIIPEKTETEKHLRSVKMGLRHCVFHGEAKLKTFAHYTQRNCEMECVAETSLRYCECISYHMPKIARNLSVCSIKELECLSNIKIRLENHSTSCLDDCLPACYEMNFQINSFSTKLSPKGMIANSLSMGNRTRGYAVENVAVVHMFFKENTFRSNVNTEFIGLSEFLSSIGGLMGLFLGFSFLSIAECIFYAILRPYRSLRQHQKSLDMQRRRHKQTTSLQRSKKLNRELKSRYKKIFENEKKLRGRKIFCDKSQMVPYSIAYGFDGPSKEKFPIIEYVE